MSLLLAAENGDVNVLKLLLEMGADINIKNKDGFNVLSVASAHGKVGCVLFLLEELGIDVDVKNEDGSTALVQSILEDFDHKCVEILVKHGADVNAKYDYKCLLNIIMECDEEECDDDLFQMFIDNGADVNVNDGEGTPLIYAASRCYCKRMTTLLENCADVNARLNNGETALFQAAMCNGGLEAVRLLLKYGADVNIRCEVGYTALMEATRTNNLDIVKLLIERGTDINNADVNGNTALIISIEKWCLEIFAELLRCGAEFNTRTEDGDTPLMVACERDVKFASLLIERGADINAKNNAGDTPLIKACLEAKSKCVSLLIKHGAELNIRNNNGKTALMSAVDYGWKIRAKVGDIGYSYHSSEHKFYLNNYLEIKGEHTECMSLLIKNGADLNIRDNAGNTALHRAYEKEFKECVLILKDALPKNAAYYD